MSKKVHPIGFRLGISQPWVLTQPLFSYHQQLGEQLTIYLWIKNFTAQNAFYCLQTTYVSQEWRAFLFLTFFIPIRRSLKRLKVRLFRLKNTQYSLRRRRKLLGTLNLKLMRKLRSCILLNENVKGPQKQNLLVYQKQISNFKFIAQSLWNSYFWVLKTKVRRKKKQKQRNRFLLKAPHIVSLPLKGSRVLSTTSGVQKKKKKTLVTRAYLRYLFNRLQLLRLKFFIETHLRRYFKNYLTVHLTNVNDVFLNSLFSRQLASKYTYARLNNASRMLVNKLTDYNKYAFLVTYTNLLVTSTLLRVPHILLQWLWLYSYRIKKHSLYLTHNQLFSLFEKSLENLILLVGLVKGVKMEVTGKLFDSTRTRKQISYYGYQYKRQTLVTSFIYSFKQIPTYIGVLGFRLWFIY